jgi:hypothetical protein
MFKRYIFIGITCFAFVKSYGQTISSQRKEDLNINKFYKTTVSLNSPSDSVSFAIHSISIVDARPDTSAIGLVQISKVDPRFIVTQRNFQVELEQFLNKYVQCEKSDSFSVLMVLNKFWMSTSVHKFDDWNTLDTDEDTSKVVKIILFTKIDFYLYKDSGYYALYRFDSVFSADVKKSLNKAGNIHQGFVRYMIQDALATSLSKLTNMDSRWKSIVSSKRKFTWQEIAAHDRKYFEIPILKDTSVVPGVYLTFEEFKANSPSVKEFQITKDKLNDIISIKQPDGKQIPVREAWGYCDSSNHLFIRSNYNYFRLQRRQNAFYIYGSNQTVHITNDKSLTLPAMYSGSPNGMPVGNFRSELFTMLLRPFQLDWDSGKLD